MYVYWSHKARHGTVTQSDAVKRDCLVIQPFTGEAIALHIILGAYRRCQAVLQSKNGYTAIAVYTFALQLCIYIPVVR